MITAPLLTHAVKLELPRASSQQKAPAPKVEIAIDAAGQRYWDGAPVDAGAVDARLTQLGRSHPETGIHLHADKSARYELVAEVMTAASRAGLARIGFITQPKR